MSSQILLPKDLEDVILFDEQKNEDIIEKSSNQGLGYGSIIKWRLFLS